MLYNLSTLDGFSLGARDGEIGSVEDFYFDDDAWAVRYLAVDTGSWLAGRRVLISPASLGKVDWEGRRIKVALGEDQIENSPHIDAHKPISRQHETEFYD